MKNITTIKDDVMTLLGDEVNGDQVDTIIRMVSQQLLRKIQRFFPEYQVVPEELTYIITEVTIARFNRIGSEGMNSESVEGYQANYKDLFKDYAAELLDWAEFNGYEKDQRGKVRYV